MVIKKDESRTIFDREKLVRSINISCRKRPVKQEQIELITNSIQRRLEVLVKQKFLQKLSVNW